MKIITLAVLLALVGVSHRLPFVSAHNNAPPRNGSNFRPARLLPPPQNSESLISGDPNVAPIEFRPMTFVTTAGESVEAEQGSLVVPEKHAAPKGSSIRLGVVRFKSTAEKPGAPIVYLAGGPGVSGIESAKGAIFPVITALRARADVIVYDQRGTGGSEPSLMLPGKLDLPLEATLDSPASQKALATRARDAAAEIKRRGIDLSAYNTLESADDLNDLRLGLAAQKITIWGHSYGSHLGFAVLRRHAEFIDRAILSGVNGPDQRWRYPNDLQALIECVDELIKTVPKLHRSMPSLKQTVAQVLKQLGEKPFTAQVRSQAVVVGRKDVEVLVALQAGDRDFVKSLPVFFGSMKDGNFTQVAFAVAQGLKQRELGTAMRYSMHIASGVSTERAAKIEVEKGTALFRNAINFPFDDKEFQEGWGVRDLGADFRGALRSDVPTLFLSGTLDGRTSIADAEAVKRGFTKAQHLIVEGAAHDLYGLTPKICAAILDFLDGHKVPERISVPIEIRGPDERRLIQELRKIILEKGAEAGVKRMREMSSPKSDAYLTSYVPGILAFILSSEEKNPDAALAIYQAAVELFPDNEFLIERFADASAAAGRKDVAREYYIKSLALNSLNRAAYVKLHKLNGS